MQNTAPCSNYVSYSSFDYTQHNSRFDQKVNFARNFYLSH